MPRHMRRLAVVVLVVLGVSTFPTSGFAGWSRLDTEQWDIQQVCRDGIRVGIARMSGDIANPPPAGSTIERDFLAFSPPPPVLESGVPVLPGSNIAIDVVTAPRLDEPLTAENQNEIPLFGEEVVWYLGYETIPWSRMLLPGDLVVPHLSLLYVPETDSNTGTTSGVLWKSWTAYPVEDCYLFTLDIGAISGSVDPVRAGETTSFEADFLNTDASDTHTATWNWGDGSTTTGQVAESGGSGVATGEHAYSTPGIYTVTLTVTDDDGTSDQDTFEHVVVYDPDAGFVAGLGGFNSPPGAYPSNPQLGGKAQFVLASRYRKGASVPSGISGFRFNAGDLNFLVDSYEWLMISADGANAQLKGVGTINREPAPTGELYTFMIWAGDASPDTFRIRIWYEDGGSEVVIYDNGIDQPISAGAIVIYTK